MEVTIDDKMLDYYKALAARWSLLAERAAEFVKAVVNEYGDDVLKECTLEYQRLVDAGMEPLQKNVRVTVHLSAKYHLECEVDHAMTDDEIETLVDDAVEQVGDEFERILIEIGDNSAFPEVETEEIEIDTDEG